MKAAGNNEVFLVRCGAVVCGWVMCGNFIFAGCLYLMMRAAGNNEVFMVR